MFNPLTPAQVTLAVGRAARDAARNEEPASAFARGQLLSAYSIARHLAVDLEAYGPELTAFRTQVADAVEAGAADAALRELGAAVRAAATGLEAGDATCRLLDALRAERGAQAAGLRAAIRAALRRLVDREVELLAEAIEGPAG